MPAVFSFNVVKVAIPPLTVTVGVLPLAKPAPAGPLAMAILRLELLSVVSTLPKASDSLTATPD